MEIQLLTLQEEYQNVSETVPLQNIVEQSRRHFREPYIYLEHCRII